MLPSDKQTSPISAILVVEDLDRATDFYYRMFGALEKERYAGPDGKVWYAVIDVLGTPVQLMEPFADMGHAVATPESVARYGDQVVLHAHVEDVAGTFQKGLKAKAAGLADGSRTTAWGEGVAELRDPFGHRWTLGSRLTLRDQALASVAVSLVSPDVAATTRFFSQVFSGARAVGHQGAVAPEKHSVLHVAGAPLQVVHESSAPDLRAVSRTGRPGGDTVIVTVSYDDVDGASERAIAAGGVSVIDPQDAYWGDRYTEFRSAVEGVRLAACSEEYVSNETVVTPEDAQMAFRDFLVSNDNPSSPAEAVGVRNV